MRALTIVVLALVLAVVRGQSQSEARDIENRWANCSEVVKGRLGALHGENGVHPLIHGFNGTFLSVDYSPCVLHDDRWFLKVTRGNDECTYTQVDEIKGTSSFVDFIMPTKQGEVARFHASYSSPNPNAFVTCQPSVLVKTECTGNETSTYVAGFVDPRNGDPAVPLWDAQMKDGSVFPNVVVVHSTEACPRFPYSNKGVPPGGVGAIIVVVICFVLQFGICAWYHKTHAAIATNMDEVDAAYTQHE